MIKRSMVSMLLLAGHILFASLSLHSQRLTFYYVAPTAALRTAFTSGTDTALCPMGYSKVLVTSTNEARFRSSAPERIKYVYNQLQAGNALRTQVDRVLLNSAGAVTNVFLFLVDDRTGFSGSAADTSHIFLLYDDNSRKYVWPAANNRQVNGSSFVGWAMFGEHQLETDQVRRTGGLRAIDEVVLHETSHTQLTGEWTKWGAISGNAVTYGADGMHYFRISELIGDQEGALNEGLATFYGFIMNDSAYLEMLRDYSSAGHRYFVEARSVLAGSRDLYTVRERRMDTLTNAHGSAITYPDGRPVIMFTYRWHDVPGFYLLFAEITSTAFYSIFHRQSYANRDTALSMIRFSTIAMSPSRRKRFLSYACNRLALRMEEYNASTAGRADTSRISSIYPFAVLDLVTHFGMTDAEFQADYRRNYADRDPRAYTEYFTRRRAIRDLVWPDLTASPIRFDQALQKIRQYCRRAENMF